MLLFTLLWGLLLSLPEVVRQHTSETWFVKLTEVIRMSELLWSLTVRQRPVVRPSVVRSHFLVYTLASTNINQSAPKLVKMYMTIGSRMSMIMGLIRPERPGLSTLELENLPYLTIFTLQHLQVLTIRYQTWPQYICLSGLRWVWLWVKLNQNIRSYLPLNLEKTAESDFAYTFTSKNIDQSAPNLVKMYMTIRSQMSLIMGLIKSEQLELSALELENMPYLTMFTL